MTDVITPAEVERSIMRISTELEEMIGDLTQAADTAKRAEVTWKRNQAMTRITRRRTGGTGPGGRATESEVDDFALNKHGDDYEHYKVSEGVYEALRDAMFTKRAQLDALRTIAANIRAASS